MASLTAAPQSAGGIADFYERIRRECPAVPLRIDEDTIAAKSHDRWPAAAKWTAAERDTHLPAAVLQPVETEQVAKILAAATAAGVSVVPYGAGSGVV
ncbi:MAG: hypothetical protein ACRD0P_34145, partial [Stackebrandtia sp.]